MTMLYIKLVSLSLWMNAALQKVTCFAINTTGTSSLNILTGFHLNGWCPIISLLVIIKVELVYCMPIFLLHTFYVYNNIEIHSAMNVHLQGVANNCLKYNYFHLGFDSEVLGPDFMRGEFSFLNYNNQGPFLTFMVYTRPLTFSKVHMVKAITLF